MGMINGSSIHKRYPRKARKLPETIGNRDWFRGRSIEASKTLFLPGTMPATLAGLLARAVKPRLGRNNGP